MILGVDVWSGYGKIDWSRAASSGVRFVYAKCTEGNNGKDGRFNEYISGARNAGLYVGAYLFGFPLPTDPKKPGRDPKDQARRLYHDCQGLGQGRGELPPVLDLEWPPHYEKVKGTSQTVDKWAKWKVDANFIADWGLECLAEMYRLWGRVPIVYTYPWFWASLGDRGRDPEWAQHPLWIASGGALDDWVPPESKSPAIPRPWSSWAVWQFGFEGSSIRVPGIPACPVDRDVFNGGIDDLRRLANIDPNAETLPELPNSDDNEPVDVEHVRTLRLVHPALEFSPLEYDNGPGEPPDDDAA